MINKERLENLTQEVWKGAIKLRGKFKAKDYPSVILPMIMIRRIESVLEVKRDEFKTEIITKNPKQFRFSVINLRIDNIKKGKTMEIYVIIISSFKKFKFLLNKNLYNCMIFIIT